MGRWWASHSHNLFLVHKKEWLESCRQFQDLVVRLVVVVAVAAVVVGHENVGQLARH